MNFNAIPWKDFVTMGVATLGAVLGVMNTWNAMNQKRVRLRVRPLRTIIGSPAFCIEVTNLSAFPVTVNEVGICIGRHGIVKGNRLAVISPILHDGKPWPRRLEPRESVSVYFNPKWLVPHANKIGKAYARTECGEVELGDSPALKQFREELTS